MYSKWNKLDLHIHTDMSNITKTNDYKCDFSVDILCKKLKEYQIKLMSLTDHNIINCTAYDELAKKDLSFLVGVELDVCISEDEMKTYIKKIKNSNSEKIEVKPFHCLVFFRNKNHKEISRKLEKMYESVSIKTLNGIANLKEEKKYRVTTIEYIVKSFCNEDFFIIAHGNKSKGIVSPYAKVEKINEAQKEILVGGISALEMQSNANIESVINNYNEGFKKLMNDDFKTTKTTSYVVFSDNHNCENYKPRSLQTWIKGDLSYETLRLAFSDPESRIHTSRDEPSLNTNFIESIQLKINDCDKQEIKLSPYLNVIIGGRSSGKSLLFNSLINMNNEFTEDDKSVFKKNYSKLVDLTNTYAKLGIGDFSKTISIPGEAFYQEAIIKLFEKENDLKTKLQNEFMEISDIEIREIENKLDDIVLEFNNAYEDYYNIASKINKGDVGEYIEVVLRNSSKLFDINLDELDVKCGLSDYTDVLSKFTDFNKNIINIKDINIYNERVFNTKEIELLDSVFGLISNKIELIEEKKCSEDIKIKFKDKLESIKKSYVSKELTAEKRLIEQTKYKLEGHIEDYRTYFSSKLKLQKACEKIKKLDMKIENKVNKKSKYKFVTKVNLNISGTKIVNEFFKDKIMNYFDTMDLFKNILNLADVSLENVRIKQHTSDGKSPYILKEKFNSYIRNIKSKKTYEIIECLDNGHEISTLSTSQGKKASIFLDIKLKNMLNDYNKNVLFIDQLEDNIDNKYISEELVKLIRDLKTKVQIILVTHNPSIAIYGDAENIIISESTGNKFKYTQGGLENVLIREEACKILDGGEVAFKNRMDKYDIAILNEGDK